MRPEPPENSRTWTAVSPDLKAHQGISQLPGTSYDLATVTARPNTLSRLLPGDSPALKRTVPDRKFCPG